MSYIKNGMEWEGRWFRRADYECGGVAVGLIVMDEDLEAKKVACKRSLQGLSMGQELSWL